MSVILILFFLCFIFSAAWIVDRDNIFPWGGLWMMLALTIFLLSSFREGGSDWESYNSLYSQVSDSGNIFNSIDQNDLFEPLYVALNYGFSIFFTTRRELVVFESFVNALAIYLILKKSVGGPILLIWLFPLQFANILGVRQTFAISLVIIGSLMGSSLWRLFIMIAAPFVHLSSVLLYFANYLMVVRLSAKNFILCALGVALIYYFLSGLIHEKLLNYQLNGSELTDLSAAEVVVGKLVTMIFLSFLLIFSARWTENKRMNSILILIVFSLASSFAGLISPALVRLSTPFELILAWQCSKYICSIKNLRFKLIFFLAFCVIAAIKMLKINYQFQDVYEVCFFCVA